VPKCRLFQKVSEIEKLLETAKPESKARAGIKSPSLSLWVFLALNGFNNDD